MKPLNKPPKERTLKDELKALDFSYKVARSKIQYSKNFRTYGQLAQSFGINVGDPLYAAKPIYFKDLELFKQQLTTIIKDRYASRKYITDIRTADTVIVPTINGHSKEIGQYESLEEIPSGTTSQQKEDDAKTEEPDSWVAKYPDQKCDLMIAHCNQQRAAKEIWKLIERGESGIAVIAGTGSGKTFLAGNIIKNIIEHGMLKPSPIESERGRFHTFGPWPIVYVTKATVVQQTKGVLKEMFNIDATNTVRVFNIELLRSEFGKYFVREQILVTNGQEHVAYKWIPNMYPRVFIWDEFQQLAREESIQTMIASAATEIPEIFGEGVLHIFMSAAPFSRVCEMKVFACSTKKQFDYGLQKIKLCSQTWKHFANIIASPSDPYTYCEAAIKRAVDFFEQSNIVRIRGIRPKFKAYNSVSRISFQTTAEAAEYAAAWDKYQEMKAKIEGDDSLSASQTRFAILAQFTIFAKAAERIRAYHLAKFFNDTWQVGEAPACGARFKGTIVKMTKHLIMDFGWKRSDISIIWGGSTETLNAKQKILKQVKMKQEEMEELLGKMGFTMKDIGIDLSEVKEKNAEDYAFEKDHNLLTQKMEDRERERMRFQRQDSKGLIFTYAAGGVGLSAHHEGDAHYKPLYPKSRPRRGIFTPVYSEKQLIQGFGRLPRITSCSDTFQSMCYYGGTIEEQVAARVIMKLKCMIHVVKSGKSRESWEDIVTGRPVEIDDGVEVEDGGFEEDTGLIQEYIEETKV